MLCIEKESGNIEGVSVSTKPESSRLTEAKQAHSNSTGMNRWSGEKESDNYYYSWDTDTDVCNRSRQINVGS